MKNRVASFAMAARAGGNSKIRPCSVDRNGGYVIVLLMKLKAKHLREIDRFTVRKNTMSTVELDSSRDSAIF